MGIFGDIWSVGKEVGSVGLDVAEHVGPKVFEHAGLIGNAVSAGEAIYNSSKAHDAEMAHDYEGADQYGSEAAYDWVKAVPVLGTAMGVGELASGAYWGGKAALNGRGFAGSLKAGVAGMDNFKDTAKDLGSMAGISEFGGSKYAHLGAHGELRESVEGRDEHLREYVAKKQEGKQ